MTTMICRPSLTAMKLLDEDGDDVLESDRGGRCSMTTTMTMCRLSTTVRMPLDNNNDMSPESDSSDAAR
jgi:hypothetical protein